MRLSSQRQEQRTSNQQVPRLMASSHMKEAMHLLTIPAQELVLAISDEIEANPLLDYADEWEEETGLDELLLDVSERDTSAERTMVFDDRDFRRLASMDRELEELFALSEPYIPELTREQLFKNSYREGRVHVEESLYAHLMDQARDTFENADELRMAEYIVGNLDERGFLSGHLLEIAVAHRVDVFKLRKVQLEVQSFLPAGVAADDVQESLLLQLTRRNRHGSLAWRIIAFHFDDLIHHRLSVIQRALDIDEETLKMVIEQEIAPLDPHPGLTHARELNHTITPDVIITEVGEHLQALVNTADLPSIKLNQRYLHMMQCKELPPDATAFLKAKFRAGRWFINTLRERNQTISSIAQALLQKQIAFFTSPQGKLQPLTMRQLARELHVHESTISRIVANKYLSSPRGTFPLRYFFSGETVTKHGESLSTRSVKERIGQIIDEEDSAKPLSDGQIAKKLHQQGISCARRTVAKYRKELDIPSTSLRRQR